MFQKLNCFFKVFYLCSAILNKLSVNHIRHATNKYHNNTIFSLELLADLDCLQKKREYLVSHFDFIRPPTNAFIPQQFSTMTKLPQKKIVDKDEEFKISLSKQKSLPEKLYIRWTKEENKQYAIFLQEFELVFENLPERKNSMVFKKMAESLNNGRSNCQCRSHHIKMLRKYGSIQNIIHSSVPAIPESPSPTYPDESLHHDEPVDSTRQRPEEVVGKKAEQTQQSNPVTSSQAKLVRAVPTLTSSFQKISVGKFHRFQIPLLIKPIQIISSSRQPFKLL